MKDTVCLPNVQLVNDGSLQFIKTLPDNCIDLIITDQHKPKSRAFRAVSLLLPNLHGKTWNRNWKPFFEALVVKCEMEESHADAQLRRVTHGNSNKSLRDGTGAIIRIHV